ncbi:unnamed protein product, partial [Coregonus sp. 'balchen']
SLVGLCSKLKSHFQQAQQANGALEKFRVISAYRRNKNLKDILVHSSLTQKKKPLGNDKYLLKLKYLKNTFSGLGAPIWHNMGLEWPMWSMGLVILDKHQYTYEANRQLSNTKYYVPIEDSIQPQTQTKLRRIIQTLYDKRRNPNLKDLLVHATFSNRPSPPVPMESHYYRQLTNIHNPHAHTFSPIKQLMNINSTNIVYAITCALCQKIYVGETGSTILTRLKQHLYTITNNKLSTHLVIHFQTHPIIHLNITRLETVSTWTIAQRKAAESKRIATLRSLAPLGLNGK